jgi:hypothetical protein
MAPVALRPGSRWRSVRCATEVIVVRPPSGPVDLGCGGSPMVPADSSEAAVGPPQPDLAAGTLLGKRYEVDGGGELLCTKAGQGTLTSDGEPVTAKTARALPASD